MRIRGLAWIAAAALVLAALVSAASAQTTTPFHSWKRHSDLPPDRIHYGGAGNEVAGKFWVMGKPWNEWWNYLYEFDPSTLAWSLISQTSILNVNATVGSEEPALWFQSGVVLDSGYPTYFFGVSNNSACVNSCPTPIWRPNALTYNPVNNTLDVMTYTWQDNPRRQGTKVVRYGDEAIVFGGCLGNPNRDDTLRYNISAAHWTTQATNSTPPGRCGHTSVMVDGTDKMLVFGGHAGGGFFDDLWEFSIESSEWRELVPVGAKPEARCYHSAVFYDGVMLVFGGDGFGPAHLDDLWGYVYAANRWLRLVPDASADGWLSPRAHHAYAVVGDSMFIYGGITYDTNGGNVFLSDTWEYKLGCKNNCSGASGGGVCSQFVCSCDPCFGGTDCSIDLCATPPPGVNITIVNRTETIVIDEKDTSSALVIGIVIPAALVCCCCCCLASWISYRYRKFVKAKQAAKLAGEGGGDGDGDDVELTSKPAETPSDSNVDYELANDGE